MKVPATDTAGQRRPSWLGCDWVWGLILVLAVILAYQPVWHAGFIWDDDVHVTANPCIVGPLGLKEIWTTSAAQFYPLALTTFWLEHALWGLQPLPYHLVNVILHANCAILLWRVLRMMQVPGAWLGAALWALHPVEVESVAWITEMKNTESGLFFLLSILFFLRWLKARDVGGKTASGWCYALSLLFAALAMASKSSTVILPVVLCLCAWWVESGWHWRNLARVIPFVLMSVASVALTMRTANLQELNTNTPWERNWPERLVTAGDAVWFYLGKLVWPHPLITVYPRWQIDAGSWVSYVPLLAVIIILFILWLKRESWSRPAFFALAYFLAALLPVLGLVDAYIFRYSLVFDHFQYLASMGPLALAGAGMARLVDFVIPGKLWLQGTLGAGVLLILGLLSWQRAWVYESEETLWTDTLGGNPNCWIGCNNLGTALAERQQTDEAIAYFQKALELNPNAIGAHNNLGLAFAQKGRLDEAIGHFQKALELNPNLAETHNNLGFSFAQEAQTDAAIAQYQKALTINPDYAKAHNNLGIALARKGRVDEAMAQFQMALESNPNYAEAHYNLGNSFLQKGQPDDAITHYQKALELNPNLAEAHYNLGDVLLQKGQLDEAIIHYRKVLEINPNHVKAHINLGVALFQKGQVDEAIAQFQEVLRLDPNNSDAQTNLARVKAMAGQVPGSGAK